MVFSPSLIYAQQITAIQAARGQAAQADDLDLSYVTPEAALGVVVHPRRVLTAPELEMLPIEVISAAGKKELGVDPVDVERVVLVAEPPQAGSPPSFGAVAYFSKPYGELGAIEPLLQRTVEAELDGKAYRRGRGMMDFSLYMPDDKTLIIAHDPLLRKMLANRQSPSDGPVSTLLRKEKAAQQDLIAVLSVGPLRPLVAGDLARVPLPPPFVGLKRVPDLLSAVEVKFNMTGDQEMALIAYAEDEDAAKEIEKLIDSLIRTARQMMAAEMAKDLASDDPVERALAQYGRRMSERIFEMMRPTRIGDRLELSGSGRDQSSQIATIGILIALLLPAVQAAREAARRAQSTNNLRQIGWGLHNYHESRNQFPARAVFDDDGKPLLSWRVQVLPYLEQEALYRQFKLDEPWDSEHNRKLIPAMPAIYRNPSRPPEQGKADYLAVVGEGLMFDGTEATTYRQIKDGLSNTIMVVEANPDEAITWTKPDDWQYDPQEPLAGLGDAHPGGFSALFGDISVHFISNQIEPSIFRALLTIDGGEAVAAP
jgi:hypothetical protein